MAYQNPGLIAVKQNFLIYPDTTIGAGSSGAYGAGFELENTMNLMPGKTGRFSGADHATEKVIEFLHARGTRIRQSDCVAIVNPHSRKYIEAGQVPYEERLKFQLWKLIQGGWKFTLLKIISRLV